MADWDMMNEALAAAGDAAPANKRLDPLVRYMIFHWALGTLAGTLFATALLAIDPFGLRLLMNDSGMGAEAAFLLYVGFMTTFGSLVCGRRGDVPAERRRSAAPRPARQRRRTGGRGSRTPAWRRGFDVAFIDTVADVSDRVYKRRRCVTRRREK
jgi:hypothetical protein